MHTYTKILVDRDEGVSKPVISIYRHEKKKRRGDVGSLVLRVRSSRKNCSFPFEAIQERDKGSRNLCESGDFQLRKRASDADGRGGTEMVYKIPVWISRL